MVDSVRDNEYRKKFTLIKILVVVSVIVPVLASLLILDVYKIIRTLIILASMYSLLIAMFLAHKIALSRFINNKVKPVIKSADEVINTMWNTYKNTLYQYLDNETATKIIEELEQKTHDLREELQEKIRLIESQIDSQL